MIPSVDALCSLTEEEMRDHRLEEILHRADWIGYYAFNFSGGHISPGPGAYEVEPDKHRKVLFVPVRFVFKLNTEGNLYAIALYSDSQQELKVDEPLR